MATKYHGMEEPPFLKVATLDIESLSTRMNCAITEIGYIVCMIPQEAKSDYSRWREFLVEEGTIHLDLLEQLKLGRHVDPKTIEWQEKQHGTDNYRSLVYRQPDSEGFSYAFNALKNLKYVMKGVHELWLNHPTFDSGRLHTLAEQLGIYDGLWDHRAEMDIHSIKYKFGIDVEADREPAHRGLEDCYYNLDLLSQITITHQAQWHPFTGLGYYWYEKSVEKLEEQVAKVMVAGFVAPELTLDAPLVTGAIMSTTPSQEATDSHNAIQAEIDKLAPEQTGFFEHDPTGTKIIGGVIKDSTMKKPKFLGTFLKLSAREKGRYTMKINKLNAENAKLEATKPPAPAPAANGIKAKRKAVEKALKA